jgi:hypothetical protein
MPYVLGTSDCVLYENVIGFFVLFNPMSYYV